MKIEDLIIMQETLSEVEQFKGMVDFVQRGGFFTKTALDEHESVEGRKNFSGSRVISLTQFEDYQFFIHDGHHRIGSIFAAGRDYLREDEYTVTEMRYVQYDEINFDVNFVTPFVPPLEVRLSDFADFKNTAVRLFRIEEASYSHNAVFYIRNNRHLYCKKRTIKSVSELVKGMPCQL